MDGLKKQQINKAQLPAKKKFDFGISVSNLLDGKRIETLRTLLAKSTMRLTETNPGDSGLRM